MFSLELLNALRSELETERKLKEKYQKALEKIANGVDLDHKPKPLVLTQELMAQLALETLSHN
jgi:hypothetical protein